MPTPLTMAKTPSWPADPQLCRIPIPRPPNAATALPISGNGSCFHGFTSLALGKLTKGWKSSGVVTAGSGRPVNPAVVGDANQDGNSNNDRLPGLSRNSLFGPNYATTSMRIARKFYVRKGVKLELTAESFNLFNRLNRRFQLTDDGALSNAAQFQFGTQHIGNQFYPAYYQVPTNFMRATSAYAPRQVKFSLRLGF